MSPDSSGTVLPSGNGPCSSWLSLVPAGQSEVKDMMCKKLRDLVYGGCEPQEKVGVPGVRAARSTALCPYLVEREPYCWQNWEETGLRLIGDTAVHVIPPETNKKSPRKSTFWNCWVRGNETFCYDTDVLFLNYFCFYSNKKLK